LTKDFLALGEAIRTHLLYYNTVSTYTLSYVHLCTDTRYTIVIVREST